MKAKILVYPVSLYTQTLVEFHRINIGKYIASIGCFKSLKYIQLGGERKQELDEGDGSLEAGR